jgi:hypothetical protein
MNSEFIDKNSWVNFVSFFFTIKTFFFYKVFEFSKITYFITTFAPCYPENHPRYTFGVKNSYILFQPEVSFALHDLPYDTPNTSWDNPVTVRDKIRVAYKNAGRNYHIRETTHYPMAFDMIRPLNKDSTNEIIEWWLYKDDLTL